MNCPFCRADLDPRTMSCPRCGAEHPTGGTSVALGFRLRSLFVAFMLILVMSLILVNCVLERLPSSSQTERLRSPAVMRELQMMQRHQQGTQNTGAPPPMR